MTVKKFSSALFGAALTTAVVLSLPLEAHAQVQAPDAQDPNASVLTFQNPAPGSAALMDRIDRLERDIRTLNQQLAQMPTATPAGAAPAPAQVMPATPQPATPQPVTPQVEFTKGEGMLSRLMVRIGALESEVRAATGQSESLSFRIDQLTQRFDKLLVDLDYRLARLEGSSPGSFSSTPTVSAAPAPLGVSKEGTMPPVEQSASQGTMLKNGVYQPAPGEGGVLGTVSKAAADALAQDDASATDESTAAAAPVDTAAVQTPPVPEATPAAPPAAAVPAAAAPAAAAPAVLPEGSVQERYRFAFDLTRQARYDEAEIAFKAFIAAHGEDALANNARYWLAETYYVRERFMDAAQAFFEAYQKAPTGSKAPDALLKLGMSMAGLDKPSEACATFGKLRKEFTPLKAAVEQALNREIKRLACK